MKRLYCLRDDRAEIWYPPFPAANDQDATRSFGSLLSQRDTLPQQHPADFALYFVGEFDESAEQQPILEVAQIPTKLWTGDGLLRFHAEVRAGVEGMTDE